MLGFSKASAVVSRMAWVVIFLPVFFLGGCGGGEAEPSASASGPVTTISREQLVSGRNNFLRTCATCHGTDAKGLPNNGQNLTDNEFVRSQTDDQLLQYVVEGREVPGGVPMPPRGGFKEADLSDQQILDVIAYVRQFPANRP